jgi:diaminopimelate epimerase
VVAHLCNRRFGIRRWSHLLENDPESDFKMVYYNSDGSQSTMCGNGGRCLVAFAKKLKTIEIAPGLTL